MHHNKVPPYLGDQFQLLFKRRMGTADELRLRQLFDCYGGHETRGLWFEIVHKYYLEELVERSFRDIRADMLEEVWYTRVDSLLFYIALIALIVSFFALSAGVLGTLFVQGFRGWVS